MNLLKQASKSSKTHEWDLVLDSVEQQIPDEYRRFVSAKSVMDEIRATGNLPNFVVRHCTRVIVEQRQLALL